MGIENPELLSEGSSAQTKPKHAEPEVLDAELTEVEDLENLDARETHDGPGDLSNLPPSDFVSFATEGVEKEID